MSITLELSPELEAQVLQAATQQGTDAQAFIIEATRRALVSGKPRTVGSFGFLKGRMDGSSDDFLAERHAEAKREPDKEEALA